MNNVFEPYLKAAEKAPASGGKSQLIKHLKGEPLTRTQAMKAYCCFCMGYYADGKTDCQTPHCPMYPYMPYRRNKTKQEATPEQLENLKRARERKQ